jgi:hypothetical protein
MITTEVKVIEEAVPLPVANVQIASAVHSHSAAPQSKTELSSEAGPPSPE